MSLSFDCPPGSVLRRLLVLLWLACPLFGHAQGLTSNASGDNPFATDPSASSPGFSPARSFRPYGKRSQNRVPAMQPEFAEASGFNWAQFFKSAAETGTQFAAPRLFTNEGRSELGGGSLFHAGSGSSGTSGDSFDLSSRGVNFATKSSGLDLHLSLQSMFPHGLSPSGAGSSGRGSEWSGSGEGSLGGPGGMGSLGGRDAQKGSGARVSLQLKF
jgi:hypothetical protein